MRRISKSALAGFAIGITCVLYSIKMSGSLKTFLDWPSVFITIGGTLGAVVVSFPPERLKTLVAVMRKVFVNDKYDLKKDIDTIVALSEVSREKGLLALEEVIDQYTDDEFLKKGVLLLGGWRRQRYAQNALAEGDILYAAKTPKGPCHVGYDSLCGAVVSSPRNVYWSYPHVAECGRSNQIGPFAGYRARYILLRCFFGLRNLCTDVQKIEGYERG